MSSNVTHIMWQQVYKNPGVAWNEYRSRPTPRYSYDKCPSLISAGTLCGLSADANIHATWLYWALNKEEYISLMERGVGGVDELYDEYDPTCDVCVMLALWLKAEFL